jgi:hypothetical protein
MKATFLLAVVSACLWSGGATAAQKYYKGEAVILSSGEDCIVQKGKPDRQGRYEVKCGTKKQLVAPEDMRSNPDQTKTSSHFVCGGPEGCYFKP